MEINVSLISHSHYFSVQSDYYSQKTQIFYYKWRKMNTGKTQKSWIDSKVSLLLKLYLTIVVCQKVGGKLINQHFLIINNVQGTSSIWKFSSKIKSPDPPFNWFYHYFFVTDVSQFLSISHVVASIKILDGSLSG